jgi:tRNA G18 (ribose-2'-O)-methylase SpoU
MTRVPISDLDDPRIAMYRRLKATNVTRRSDQFVVEGEKLFDRLLLSPFHLASVLVTDRHESRIAASMPEGVPLFVVPHSLISVVVGFNFHRGILACGVRSAWPALDEIVQAAGRRLTLVICPALNNPENLGAIIRISDVFGVDAVVVGGPCPDPFSRRVLRVSMGTSLHTPVVGAHDVAAELDRLRSRWGVELAATVVGPAAEPVDSATRPDRFALVLGSESDGLSAEWIERCDRRITIPMRAGAESLNVAVAAGIFLHHFRAVGGVD